MAHRTLFEIYADQSRQRLTRHGHRDARVISDENALLDLVDAEAQSGDMVVCLGAGTISVWANDLPTALSARRGT